SGVTDERKGLIVKHFGLRQAIVSMLFLATAGAWCDEPVALPDTPVAKQTRRLFDALESGKRDTIQAFIAENFAASFLEAIPLDQHVDINAQFASETGGLVPRKVLSASQTRLDLIAQAKKGGASYQISLEVEAAQPNKIARLGFNRPDPAAEVPLPAVPEGAL